MADIGVAAFGIVTVGNEDSIGIVPVGILNFQVVHELVIGFDGLY